MEKETRRSTAVRTLLEPSQRERRKRGRVSLTNRREKESEFFPKRVRADGS